MALDWIHSVQPQSTSQADARLVWLDNVLSLVRPAVESKLLILLDL